MLALLGAIPIIGQMITGVMTAMFNAKVKITQAKIGGDRDVAVELVKKAQLDRHDDVTALSIFASNPLLSFLLIGFAAPLVIYIWKIIVVDKILGPGCLPLHSFCWKGNTDPITGDVADWAKTIIAFLFGSGTTMALGKMWFNRDKS
jgi:hypothetical protein